MSRKHNGRHQRSRSHYRDRLAARGITKGSDVEMPALDDLRKTQQARTRQQGHPWPTLAEREAEGGMTDV